MALMYTADVKAKYAVKVSSSECTRRLVGCDDTNDGCGHGTNGWGYTKGCADTNYCGDTNDCGGGTNGCDDAIVVVAPMVIGALMVGVTPTMVVVAPVVLMAPMVVVAPMLCWHQWL